MFINYNVIQSVALIQTASRIVSPSHYLYRKHQTLNEILQWPDISNAIMESHYLVGSSITKPRMYMYVLIFQ